jgi:hypothetical protein
LLERFHSIASGIIVIEIKMAQPKAHGCTSCGERKMGSKANVKTVKQLLIIIGERDASPQKIT